MANTSKYDQNGKSVRTLSDVSGVAPRTPENTIEEQISELKHRIKELSLENQEQCKLMSNRLTELQNESSKLLKELESAKFIADRFPGKIPDIQTIIHEKQLALSQNNTKYQESSAIADRLIAEHFQIAEIADKLASLIERYSAVPPQQATPAAPAEPTATPATAAQLPPIASRARSDSELTTPISAPTLQRSNSTGNIVAGLAKSTLASERQARHEARKAATLPVQTPDIDSKTEITAEQLAQERHQVRTVAAEPKQNQTDGSSNPIGDLLVEMVRHANERDTQLQIQSQLQRDRTKAYLEFIKPQLLQTIAKHGVEPQPTNNPALGATTEPASPRVEEAPMRQVRRI